jgi:hypothetical protein
MKFKALMVFILAVTLISGKCQNTNDVRCVELTSATRGYQKTVRVSPDSVVTTVNNRGETSKSKRKLSGEEWAEIMESIQGVAKEDIGKLPAPTSDRARDAAKHSSITITTADGQKRTHTFDDEMPHERLMPLMNVLNKTENRIHTD